jgi:CxxC motif-containing protein
MTTAPAQAASVEAAEAVEAASLLEAASLQAPVARGDVVWRAPR